MGAKGGGSAAAVTTIYGGQPSAAVSQNVSPASNAWSSAVLRCAPSDVLRRRPSAADLNQSPRLVPGHHRGVGCGHAPRASDYVRALGRITGENCPSLGKTGKRVGFQVWDGGLDPRVGRNVSRYFLTAAFAGFTLRRPTPTSSRPVRTSWLFGLFDSFILCRRWPRLNAAGRNFHWWAIIRYPNELATGWVMSKIAQRTPASCGAATGTPGAATFVLYAGYSAGLPGACAAPKGLPTCS